MALTSFPSLTFNLSNPINPKPKTLISNFSFKSSLILTTKPSSPSSPNPRIRSSDALIPATPRRDLSRAFSYVRFLEVDDEESSPWEGAVVYKRDASVAHVEYCTTLERLGMEKLSSEASRSRASDLGLRVTKAVKDFPLGTPVQISVDVTRKKKQLKLDGIVRTVISLGCNRCADLATECIFSNFTLLLTQEPIEEPDKIYTGTIFGKDKSETSSIGGDDKEEDEDTIDFDDQLYFPAEEKEIDISKNIRDLIHIEITITALCDPRCKGLCLQCGTNLNKSTCNCSKKEVKNDMPSASVFEEAQQLFSRNRNPCTKQM
eukprot:TRINITY_DN2589_c0_g2_i2.p1 TRINITY_DN2589_c0_g2~~TRINITY_DN2589_c0_g2_i2.p1  ORF type:complete len:319 (-),score=43.71 TRINITY_DN2589_c0_g2_i2:38-994(-)